MRRETNEHPSRRRLLLGRSKLLALVGLLLSAAPARPDPSNGLPTQFRPSFPVLGSGKFVNFLDGDNQAMTNAAAHVGFSLAIPLLGEHFWGRKGLWITGLSWMALTVVQESLFHAPPNPGPGYPSEVRSDLITRLVPCATLLVFDALRGGGRAALSPGLPPGRPGMPWPPMGLETPGPAEDSTRPISEPSALSSSGRVPALRTGGTVRDPVRRGESPAGCTADLLFQGSAACSWDAVRNVPTRQVAAR